jgi:hypothetical protein
MLRVYFWLRGHATSVTCTWIMPTFDVPVRITMNKGHTSPGGIVFVSCASMARKTRLDMGTDLILIDGVQHPLFTNPLEAYREKYRPDIIFLEDAPSTSCWRGYAA